MDIIIPSKVEYGERRYSTSAFNQYKTRPKDVTIDGKKYNVVDGEATKVCKEVATALGIAFKDSWFTHRIAQAILEKVLGSSYKKPTRGACQTVYNCAIFDGVVILHDYTNDGWGNPDSIQKGCYVYK